MTPRSVRPNLLAIDTSSSGTFVVAQRADGLLAGRGLLPNDRKRPQHTTHGLALAAQVLEEVGLTWTDLERIGVGTGPGSFTGLRSGLAAAAGLARRLEIPLIGITATEMLAYGAINESGQPVMAVVDGRRRELFVARWPANIAAKLASRSASIETWRTAGSGIEVVRRDSLQNSPALAGIAGALVVGDGALLERDALLALGADVPEPQDQRHSIGVDVLAKLTAYAPPTSADAVHPTYGRAADAIPTAAREAAARKG